MKALSRALAAGALATIAAASGPDRVDQLAAVLQQVRVGLPGGGDLSRGALRCTTVWLTGFDDYVLSTNLSSSNGDCR